LGPAPYRLLTQKDNRIQDILLMVFSNLVHPCSCEYKQIL
jgi:hypothetical protein